MNTEKTGKSIWFSLLWFYLVTVAAPLYFEDEYFNLLQAKARICDLALAVLLGGSLAAGLWGAMVSRRRLRLPRLVALDVVLLGFGALALLSCLLSGYPAQALWGMEGWGVGGLAMAGTAAACCVLARTLPYRHNLWLPVLAVNLPVFLLSTLHAAKIDALGLHRDILPSQWFYYLSTIGNRNWYAGYLCLLVPLAAAFWLSATQRATRIILFCFLAPACLNLVICTSDSVYLGLGLCLFFALPYATSNARRLSRSFVLLGLYGAALLVFRYVPAFGEMLARTKGLSRTLLHPAVGGLMLAAGVAGAVLAGRYWDRLPQRWRRSVSAVLELLLAAAALGLLVYTVRHFSDRWGTNRGRTWRVSVELFRSLPLSRKLLGVGPELLGLYYSDLSGSFLRTILSAHSTPLQILLTNGLLGLACWGAAWGMLFWRCLRLRLWREDAIAFFLPLAAYFGYELVNGPQPLNVALLCVMAACFRIHTECFCPAGLDIDVPVHPTVERKKAVK